MTAISRTEELLVNASYMSETEIEFILKRPRHRLRGATYRIETHNQEMRLQLNVSPNGNMTAQIGFDAPTIAEGSVYQQTDMETIRWSDTGNLAIIRTALMSEHVTENLPARTIMQHFLDAISNEESAIGKFGHERWRREVNFELSRLASKMEHPVAVLMEMPRTVCPGLENMHPWFLPRMQFNGYNDGLDAPFEIDVPDDVRTRIEVVTAERMPRRSELVLRPPFLVRQTAHIEFIQEPGSVVLQNLGELT